MTADQLKIAVIGGSGFIGTRLCRQLVDAGHSVTNIDKRPASQPSAQSEVIADVRDLDSLSGAVSGHHLIYNLAAEHQDNVQPISLYDEVNVAGASNVCEAATRTGITQIIFTSSVAVYGSQQGAMSEDTDHQFFNDYGRTKHLAEKVFQSWLEQSPSHRLTIVRPTVVFGPGNRGNVYNFLRQMKQGPFVMFGDGGNAKSMAHVENIAAFLHFVLRDASRFAVYNYADKPDFTMKALVSFVDEALGRRRKHRLSLPQPVGVMLGGVADIASSILKRPLPISAVRVRKFCSPSEIDATRAFATGFKPKVALSDGLGDMVRHHI